MSVRLPRWRAGLLLAGLVARAAAAADESDALAAFDRAMAEAESSLHQGLLPAAETRYREALFEGWMALGTLHRLDGRQPAARAAVQEAARLAPQGRGALQSLAGAYLQMGEAARATEILGDLAAKDAQDAETRRLLAKALAAGGHSEQAVRTLDEASASAARDPEMAFLFATEYLWLKRPQAADRLFAQVVAARPIPQTRVLIGRSYRDAGEYDRARAHLQAALEQDPGVRRAHYYLGMVALADARGGPERLERAIAEFQAELKLDPQDALANDQLGAALLDAGRAAEARPALEAAVSADARSAYVHHLGRCQLALDRPAEAAASLRRALTLAREEGLAEAEVEKVHYLLGLALRKLGQAQESASHLAEAGRIAAAGTDPAGSVPAMEVSPLAGLGVSQRREIEGRVRSGLARAYLNLGVMRAQARDFAGATELLAKAAELQPDLPRVQYSLGVASFNAGQYDMATDALSRALAEQPQSAELNVVLGQAHAHLGHDAAAIEALTRALRLDASVPEANGTLGIVYLKQGRLEEAEVALRAELQAHPGDASAQQGLETVLERRKGQHRRDAP